MFKEFNIGPCFLQIGLCKNLSLFTLTDDYDLVYNQLLAIQTVDDVIIKCAQIIIGPFMICIGIANASY